MRSSGPWRPATSVKPAMGTSILPATSGLWRPQRHTAGKCRVNILAALGDLIIGRPWLPPLTANALADAAHGVPHYLKPSGTLDQ